MIMATTIEKYPVKNRYTGEVQFTAEISTTPDMLPSVKLRLAVHWAVKEKADLSEANLSGANLSEANLSEAKNLTDEQLRPIIADLWFILSQARHEVPAMIAALRYGRVDGSTYSGECACLVGTLENAGASGLPHNLSSPAERWFMKIRKGDKPGDDSVGGFAAGKALAWIEQYCRVTGIALEMAA
jgi:hypothetical protein